MTAQSFKVAPIVSGTVQATDFKFGRYIHRVHPNERLLKILEKRGRERNQGQGLNRVLKYFILSLELVKLPTSNSVHTFIGSIGTNVH